MILRTLAMLFMWLLITIFAFFGYLVIFLDFLFWDHHALHKFIFSSNADWRISETFEVYRDAYRKAWGRL